jgi:Tfp pilus assembly protein PilN
MSQQINLLAREHKPVGSALWALATLVLMLIGLLAYGAMLHADNNRLRSEAESGARQLAQVKASLSAQRQRGNADNDAAALKAEINALKPRADAVRQLLELTGSGNLGSSDGFAQHFSTLASVPENGVWITAVSVSNAGKTVTLSGRALRNESVLRYARRLNDAFAAQGVQFNSVEMTPESLMRTGEPGKPPLVTVAFKLF